MAAAKSDGLDIRERRDETGMRLAADAAVNMDHHRASVRRPVSRYLFGTVEGLVNQHDDVDGHAQFPLDISPRISSCRQLMNFSDHLHHMSVPWRSCLA